MRVPYRMASEFCEMVTPCGNGPAKMGCSGFSCVASGEHGNLPIGGRLLAGQPDGE